MTWPAFCLLYLYTCLNHDQVGHNESELFTWKWEPAAFIKIPV
uniref:Uncharacterized protein n=1 Tax=Rhizophora mucronata TaxID=61149 RepID=A0A2P2PUE8_RHIMU